MDFEQLLALVLAGVGEEEHESTTAWLRDLYDKGTGYDDALSVRDAKIAELDGSNGELTAAVQDLKARNYDLLMQLPAEETNEGNEGDGEVVEHVEDDGEVIHIDNLFEPVEKKDEE